MARTDACRPVPPPRRGTGAGQAGYGYLGVLLLVATIGAASAGSLRLGMLSQRAVAEDQLIERGLRLSRALDSYAAATPAGQATAPPRIDHLLRDPRFKQRVVRHLRRVEVDPITGQAEWGTIRDADGGGITGFHSLSIERPHRRLFAHPLEDFNEQDHYTGWVFVAGLGH